MYHSGQFVKFGKTMYTGPNLCVSHIDYCDPDEISMLEIVAMGNEIGLKGVKTFHCSKGGVNDCNFLFALQNDNDVMNLVNLIDKDRMVGIFVEHEIVNDPSTDSESLGHESETYPNVDELLGHESEIFPNIDEPLQFMGDHNDEDVHIHNSENFNNDSGDNGDSDDNQYVGSDSEFSDTFIDSECEVSDDDILFESNIDVDIEWGGLQQHHKQPCEGSTSEEVRNTSKDHPIFNKRADILDPRFELGMCFPDNVTFREAVRQHSIKQGRQVVFTVNHKNKVQAKCKHESCSWMIYASKVQHEDTFQVKTYYGKHQCPRLQKVSHANAKWVANRFQDKMWTDPKWPVESMMTVMQKEVKLTFNKWQ